MLRGLPLKMRPVPPIRHSALDIKTFAWSMLGGQYKAATKRNMPRRWVPKTKHSNVAVEDAREQGLLFLAMRREWLAQPGSRPR